MVIRDNSNVDNDKRKGICVYFREGMAPVVDNNGVADGGDITVTYIHVEPEDLFMAKVSDGMVGITTTRNETTYIPIDGVALITQDRFNVE